MGSLDSEPTSLFGSPTASPGSAEKLLQNRPTPGRKQRPPDLRLDHANNQIAAPGAPPSRKESRIGLRNLFGRSKAIVREDNIGLGNLASPTTAARFAGIQPSVTDMGTRPYAKATANLNAALSMDPITEPLPTATELQEAAGNASGLSKSHGAPRRKTLTSKAIKSSLKPPGAGDVPPLFKAFPLAIRYATLPAMTSQTESILRMNEKKDAYAAVFEAFEHGDEKARAKKKHRRHPSGSSSKLEWTSKIYVLANSSCLLQYATEGPFDRLPEKVLHLRRDSAAFASDMIPGKHWVLQVTTTPEVESLAAAEPRSIFSRIAFRHPEKRDATQILMVFENAEDMGSWMATLRAEIERLAKDTPETGETVSEETANHLRGRLSQQTLVVRDSQRYSRGSSQTPSSYANSDRPMSEGSIMVTDAETLHDASKDDASMTNSTVSHEGRQLDSLRDSAHRFSYLSTGQRTAMTSAGSSPIGSPTLGYFPQSPNNLEPLDPNALLRPSVAEIINKRRPSQTDGALEDGSSSPERSHGTAASPSSRPSSVMSSQTPNFSVPSSSARRYSRLPHSEAEPYPTFAPSPEREVPPPQILPSIPSPPSLHSTRPLSLIMDQPLPQELIPERPATGHCESRSALPAGTLPMPRLPAEQFRHESTSIQDVQKRRQTLMPRTVPGSAGITPRPQPKRLSSVNSVRDNDGTCPVLLEQGYVSITPKDDQSPSGAGSRTNTPARDRSSLQSTDFKRTFSPTATRRSKRLSIHSMLPDGSVVETEVTSMKDLPPPAAPPPSIALPPLPPNISSASRHSHFIPQHSHLPPASSSSSTLKPSPVRGLLNRRSMPHLAAEGPPPAPPPNCALPPIPQHLVHRAMQSRT